MLGITNGALTTSTPTCTHARDNKEKASARAFTKISCSTTMLPEMIVHTCHTCSVQKRLKFVYYTGGEKRVLWV